MQVKFSLGIGLSSCRQEDIVDLPDESTEEDIEQDYQDWKSNFIDGHWEIVSG